MAATQKLYPRGTVKRIVKAQSNRTVSKNADILVRGAPHLRIALLISDRSSSITCYLCKSMSTRGSRLIASLSQF